MKELIKSFSVCKKKRSDLYELFNGTSKECDNLRKFWVGFFVVVVCFAIAILEHSFGPNWSYAWS